MYYGYVRYMHDSEIVLHNMYVFGFTFSWVTSVIVLV